MITAIKISKVHIQGTLSTQIIKHGKCIFSLQREITSSLKPSFNQFVEYQINKLMNLFIPLDFCYTSLV